MTIPRGKSLLAIAKDKYFDFFKKIDIIHGACFEGWNKTKVYVYA